MKRMAIFAVAVMALVLAAGAKQTFAQSTIKIPNEFKVGGASLPKGDYTVVKKDDTHLTLRQETTGKETTVAFTGRLAQPNPPLADPQLVFDVVGDFAPSYTEYITVYILSEVWLPGADGFEVHAMKGAHQTQIVKGQKTK